MARPLRVEFKGAVYALLNRGTRQGPIFLDGADYLEFIETLGRACGKTGWQVHAFCLMPDHFRLVIETPRANLVAGMKWLLGTYSLRFNRRHRWHGPVFGGRYQSVLVDHAGGGYLRQVCDRVHTAPSWAGLVPDTQPLRDYPWSTFPHYLEAPAQRWLWLRVDRLFNQYGLEGDTPDARVQFEQAVERLRGQAQLPAGAAWPAQGCLGDVAFRQRWRVRARERLGESHSARDRREVETDRAEKLLSVWLREQGWDEAELRHRRKNDPIKLRLAGRLRRETAVTLKWLAQRLNLGHWAYLSGSLRREPSDSVPDSGAQRLSPEPAAVQFEVTWD